MRKSHARTDLNEEHVFKVELPVLQFRYALYLFGMPNSALSLLTKSKGKSGLSVMCSSTFNCLSLLRTSIFTLPKMAEYVPCLTATSSSTHSSDCGRVPRPNTWQRRWHLLSPQTIYSVVPYYTAFHQTVSWRHCALSRRQLDDFLLVFSVMYHVVYMLFWLHWGAFESLYSWNKLSQITVFGTDSELYSSVGCIHVQYQ